MTKEELEQENKRLLRKNNDQARKIVALEKRIAELEEVEEDYDEVVKDLNYNCAQMDGMEEAMRIMCQEMLNYST